MAVYSRAELTRTVANVVALFFAAISTRPLARQIRADTIKQPRASAIDIDCTELE